MRCIGLAEELASRGIAPVFVAAVGQLEWLAGEIRRRGFRLVIGDAEAEMVLALGPSVVIIDAYDLPSSLSKTIRAAGVPVVAIVDEGDGGHDADIYVNQNLGASGAESGARYLAGLSYALLRDDVLRHRGATSTLPTRVGATKVLAFFGGTDPMGAAPLLARALVATGVPMSTKMVAATDRLAAEIAQVATAPGQLIEVIGPTNRLPELAVGADLVVSAAGTSLWEMLCLGRPTAILCVVDNQRIGYEKVVAARLAAGLGYIDDLAGNAVATLAALLRDSELRQGYADAAWSAVDGRGRIRVADKIDAR
jgi:spore coat polysaccharide biosynthesis predicted glycosyltransferase SpsG